MENFVIRYETEAHLKIQLPDGFLGSWASTLKNPLKVKTSGGIIWDVEFASVRGEVWFTRSWDQVANAFNVRHKDVAVFTYDGNSNFNVIFLDNCFMEKTLTDNPMVPIPVKFATVLHDHSYKDKLMLHGKFWKTTNGYLANPIVIRLHDGTKFPVRWVNRRGTFCLIDGWTKVADRCNLSLHDFIIIEVGCSSELSLNVIRMSARNIVNTRRHLPHGMTIGAIERSVGVGDAASRGVVNDCSHLSLFRAVDYMVVVQNTSDDKFIKLPTGFAKDWGSTLNNPLLITMCNGVERTVHYGTCRGEIWLTEGWSKVANELKLGCSNLLLFKYNGKSCFQLMCFNSNCVEKMLPSKPVGKLPVKFFTMFKWDCYKRKLMMPYWISRKCCRTLKNPVTIFIDDGSSWQVYWTKVGENVWFNHGWAEVASHCSLKYEDYLFMAMRNNSEMELRIVRRDVHRVTLARNQISRVLAIDLEVKKKKTESGGSGSNIDNLHEIEVGAVCCEEDEELWTTTITNSTKTSNQPLCIPSHVTKSFFENKPANINVMLPTGEMKLWWLIWFVTAGNKRIKTNQAHFGIGWYDFVSSTELPLGQQIRFFKKRNEDTIRVQVIT